MRFPSLLLLSGLAFLPTRGGGYLGNVRPDAWGGQLYPFEDSRRELREGEIPGRTGECSAPTGETRTYRERRRLRAPTGSTSSAVAFTTSLTTKSSHRLPGLSHPSGPPPLGFGTPSIEPTCPLDPRFLPQHCRDLRLKLLPRLRQRKATRHGA